MKILNVVGWKKMSWGNLATLEYGKGLRSYQSSNAKYPVFGTNGQIGWHNEYLCPSEGVIVGRKGAYRGIHYSNRPFFVIDTAFYLKPIVEGSFNMKWAYYQLLNFDINKMDSGSAIPSTSRDAFYAIQLYVPPLHIQNKIAAILSAYDDLIENNLRRIKILEEMAQNLYREWFVKFRFPGHEKVKFVDSPLGRIPDGWEVKKVLFVAEVTYGFAFKSNQFNKDGKGLPVIRIRDVLNGTSDTFSTEEAGKKYLVENGDILVGMDGDFHMGFWVGGNAYLVQRVARFRPKDEIGKYHLYLLLQEPIQHFNATITGTTVAHLGDKHIQTIEIIWPKWELRNYISRILEPMLDQILNLRIKNITLLRNRDLLLPKLISGELDVSNLEIKIKEGIL